MRNYPAKRTPRDNALRFFRVGRTQVRDLRRLKLCQLGFPAQDPKRNTKRREHNTYLTDWLTTQSLCRHQRGKLGKCERVHTYSRTADAESVVLNFAKVLTYSRVLLYTLEIEEKEDRTEQGWGGKGKGPGGRMRRMQMPCQLRKRWMANHDWGWRGKAIGE